MKYIIFVILSTVMLSVKGQNRDNLYDSIFNRGQLIKDSQKIKQVFARYLSSDGNQIIASHIDTVILMKSRNLKNYGNAELITVALSKTAPKVLYSKFLVVVSHVTNKLSSLNLDNYYLVKTSPLDKGAQIAAIRNFRGNLELSIYDFSKGQFLSVFTKEIYVNSYCDQYKFGTLNIKNIDLNNDGKLDLSIIYKVNRFCDKDGTESDVPLYEIKQSKKLVFSPKGKRENWILK